MKILWFSNCNLCNTNINSTGAWLYTMSEALINNGVELCNITQSNVLEVTKITKGKMVQYILPVFPLTKNLPSNENIKVIVRIIENEAPDIIHIWGLESYWGLLAVKGYLKQPVILEVQGLKYASTRMFFGGLNSTRRLQCIGLKEILKPSRSIYYVRFLFHYWGRVEKEILRAQKYISIPSEWVRSHVAQEVGKDTILFKSKMAVRDLFFKETNHWMNNSSRRIVVISSYSAPYKGLHDAIESVAIVRKQYPNVKLQIVGDIDADKSLFRIPGYTRYLLKLIRKRDLIDNVEFTGPLNTEQLCQLLQKAEVMITPSYVETYCLAMAEGMAIGIPCIASFTGALPELAEHNSNALFFPLGDTNVCATHIMRLFSSEQLKQNFSDKISKVAFERNSIDDVLSCQLDIYERVLSLWIDK